MNLHFRCDRLAVTSYPKCEPDDFKSDSTPPLPFDINWCGNGKDKVPEDKDHCFSVDSGIGRNCPSLHLGKKKETGNIFADMDILYQNKGF